MFFLDDCLCRPTRIWLICLGYIALFCGLFCFSTALTSYDMFFAFIVYDDPFNFWPTHFLAF